MDISYRKANMNDFNDIVKLYKNVIKTTFTTWDKNYPSKTMIKDDITKDRLITMLKGDKIIGVVAIDDNKYIEEGIKIGGFARICISPEEQGNGYGTKLVKHVIQELKKLGCKKLRLRVSVQNISAIKMYEKCGFALVGNDYNFELEWFLYELDL